MNLRRLKKINEELDKILSTDIDKLREILLSYNLGQLTMPVYSGSAAADRADIRAEQGEDVEWIHPGTFILELDESKDLLIAVIDKGFGNPEELGSQTIVSYNFEDLQKLTLELLDDAVYRLDSKLRDQYKYYSKLMLAGQKKELKKDSELIRIDLSDSIAY